MSFLADFEPALIHSPFDRQQQHTYKPSEKVISNPSTISSISSITTQEIKKANGISLITKTMATSFSSRSALSAEQILYDRKYWTDKLVTFILMMP
ncbi:uncharacterized protein OCT59_022498 [Rhizophagus irregularis]|uniref:Uncharacterized protein n=1 Tax=Rhizophagus irregularis TaxID=588596 RepID=A0A916EAJ2_9GLOM|nr:hypothetical protein OCT59_022498 [Rhizophagus irregularis]CAB4386100.1 unnamed protein product [Rhizophagus irregularis]CAB4486394.1 unnamed protein product [Rhizophagus irregularis]CAB5121175.1 unnamed protein product [Rhizophagus irregularis]CAB5372733.1 unnamed protein product [Rhizophagus irregularis]